MTGEFDRRRFIEAALATGLGASGALAAAQMGGIAGAASPRVNLDTIRAASKVKPAGSDFGAVEHVVFLMQENRSFDHYYGSYRGVRGFDDHPAHSLGAFSQPYPAGTSRPKGRLLPYHLDTTTDIATCTHDLTHDWGPQHEIRAGGKMNQWVKVHTDPMNEGPEYGTLTMGYYNRTDIPYYYALADAFTLCDGYHCSVMGPTHPNRLMAISGTLDPDGHHGGPVLFTNPDPKAKFSVHWSTMPEVLEDAGVSWKVYNPIGEIYQITFPDVIGTTDSIFPYFAQYADPASAIHQKAFLPKYPDDFIADIATGSLPQVSWLIPPAGYDEHPPAPPGLGEAFTDGILRALMSNPEVWSKTVFFHMYDENDGFFDHVAPPVAPPGTPGEYLTVDPLPASASGVAGPIGLGYRVPMLVLSPFSRGGRVSSDVFDHTSQLRFLEERFGVKTPNVSAWRRRTVGDLTSTLDLSQSLVSTPKLPSVAGYTKTRFRSMGCTTADIVEIGDSQPHYPIPRRQKMPRQEPGRARRVPGGSGSGGSGARAPRSA